MKPINAYISFHETRLGLWYKVNRNRFEDAAWKSLREPMEEVDQNVLHNVASAIEEEMDR